jgi:hypothetical protein
VIAKNADAFLGKEIRGSPDFFIERSPMASFAAKGDVGM